MFGCPKSTFDLVAKVEEDIKELEAILEGFVGEIYVFPLGEVGCTVGCFLKGEEREEFKLSN